MDMKYRHKKYSCPPCIVPISTHNAVGLCCTVYTSPAPCMDDNGYTNIQNILYPYPLKYQSGYLYCIRI